MRIQVKETMSNHLDVFILFTTEYGDAKGRWNGESLIKNHEYHVEIDIDSVLEWGKDIYETTNESYSICLRNNLVCVSGVLESVDDDGYSILRMGDHIIPFMATGYPFSIGSFIELTIKSVSLSPINY